MVSYDGCDSDVRFHGASPWDASNFYRSTIFPPFIEFEVSLSCPQEAATTSYLDPVESTPHTHTPGLFNIDINTILQAALGLPNGLFPIGFTIAILCAFFIFPRVRRVLSVKPSLIWLPCIIDLVLTTLCILCPHVPFSISSSNTRGGADKSLAL
jgi:hypothetical protein